MKIEAGAYTLTTYRDTVGPDAGQDFIKLESSYRGGGGTMVIIHRVSFLALAAMLRALEVELPK